MYDDSTKGPPTIHTMESCVWDEMEFHGTYGVMRYGVVTYSVWYYEWGKGVVYRHTC